MEAHIFLPIFALAEQHKETWRQDPESTWIKGLLEEVRELQDALEGKHKHPPDLELMQIAAICMNWLDMRQSKRAD
jgi:hypothetical protein